MEPPFPFSATVVAELGLDRPDTLATMAADVACERRAPTPLHVMLGRLVRIILRPSPTQKAVETDADALVSTYGEWHAQRIAAVCGMLDEAEAGRMPETWRRIAHELSWRMGCACRREMVGERTLYDWS